jgi:hypothetical protein
VDIRGDELWHVSNRLVGRPSEYIDELLLARGLHSKDFDERYEICGRTDRGHR